MEGNRGNYKPEENKTCDECGIEIGDYIIYEGRIRCVGCWIEFEIKQFDDACAKGECSQKKIKMNSMMKKFTKKSRVEIRCKSLDELLILNEKKIKKLNKLCFACNEL